jgi:hypothetical protein
MSPFSLEMNSMKRSLSLGLVAVVAAVAGTLFLSRPDGRAAESPAKPDSAAVGRARKQVKMLDHIYKTTVVLITDKYVNDESDFAAGSAAVALFKSVTDAGYHKVRLIDATGKPYEDENVAKDDAEKEGLRQLKSGKAYYETIETVDGKPRLRAVTAVPVVSKKCVMCHAHYADAKQGEAIGAIVYSIPIE